MQARRRQLKTLAHAQGQGVRQHLGDITELEARQGLIDPLTQPLAADAAESSVQFEIAAHGQLFVKRKRLRDIADPRPRRDVARIDRLAQELGTAFGRGKQPGQHLHRRRLAAAIGAEEAEDLAALDAKADMVDRGEIAKAHGQAFGHDGRRSAVGFETRHGRRRARPAPFRTL